MIFLDTGSAEHGLRIRKRSSSLGFKHRRNGLRWPSKESCFQIASIDAIVAKLSLHLRYKPQNPKPCL